MMVDIDADLEHLNGHGSIWPALPVLYPGNQRHGTPKELGGFTLRPPPGLKKCLQIVCHGLRSVVIITWFLPVVNTQSNKSLFFSHSPASPIALPIANGLSCLHGQPV